MKRVEKIQKKLSEENKTVKISDEQKSVLLEQYQDKLDADPKYSLIVDPENKYSMPDSQKKFIEYYVQYKNVATAADLAKIDIDTAKDYLVAYSTQQEVRRINLAMYHRQFSTKMLNIEAIGGYLSSLLVDENVPIADRLKTMDKVAVARIIIDLNKYQQESLVNPIAVSEKDLETQIKDLSVEAIRDLIAANSKQSLPDSKKDELIKQLNVDLSTEEEAYLRTLSTDELLELVNEASTIKR